MSSALASSRPLHRVRTQLGVGVPMRDGVKLSTDVYLPDAPGPFPVILIRTPYSNNVAAGVEDASARLADVQQRLDALTGLADRVDAVDSRSQEMADSQKQAEEQLSTVVQDAERIREVFEDLAQKTEMAEGLRGRLEAFLEIEKPFTLLRGEAEGIRAQIEGTSDQLGRMREQHERLMDAHKLGTSKMEALDRRREELSSSRSFTTTRFGLRRRAGSSSRAATRSSRSPTPRLTSRSFSRSTSPRRCMPSTVAL